MNKGSTRFVSMVLGVALLIAISGCEVSDENALAEFVAEFARSAFAAYVL